MLLKLPAVLADFGLAACVAWILRATPVWAGVGAVVVLLHPATWYVSAWWGQYESIYVLRRCWRCCSRSAGGTGSAAAALAVAVLTKPQALPFLVPFAAWFLARGGGPGCSGRPPSARRRVRPVAALPRRRRPVRYLQNLGEYQNDIYSVMSLRAWNFWWIVQELASGEEFVSDRVPIIGPITFRVLGFVVTGLLVSVRGRQDLARSAAADAGARPRGDHARGVHVPDHDA